MKLQCLALQFPLQSSWEDSVSERAKVQRKNLPAADSFRKMTHTTHTNQASYYTLSDTVFKTALIRALNAAITACLLGLTCNPALAATAESGSRSISSLRFSDDGLYVKFNPAPASCGGGNQYRMHARVPSDAKNYKELTAALIAAYSGGIALDWIWVKNEGVCSSTQILELYMIEYQAK